MSKIEEQLDVVFNPEHIKQLNEENKQYKHLQVVKKLR